MQREADTFQHYQVLKHPDGSRWELGRGAMGITYKAFDINLRCHVALKVVNAQHLHSEAARARFVREARAAARLRHTNVASVYHLGTDGQNYFYAMEFIDGETLEALVRRKGPLHPQLVTQFALQVTRALGAAHRQGLVHRDIKPANLMVIPDEDHEGQLLLKVIDFGLARSVLGSSQTLMVDGAQASLTHAGFVGTPQYASPEQLEEKDLDIRSDIYSLGVTLWYLLVGGPPFTGTLNHIMSAQINQEPDWNRLLDLGVPQSLYVLLQQMLQKNRYQRPQDPAELRLLLETCLGTMSSVPVPEPSIHSKTRIGNLRTSIEENALLQSPSRDIDYSRETRVALTEEIDFEFENQQSAAKQFWFVTGLSVLTLFSVSVLVFSVMYLPRYLPAIAKLKKTPVKTSVKKSVVASPTTIPTPVPKLVAATTPVVKKEMPLVAPPIVHKLAKQTASTPAAVSAPKVTNKTVTSNEEKRVLIKLTSEPSGAEIILQGESLGVTPTAVMLEPGKYDFHAHYWDRPQTDRTVVVPASVAALNVDIKIN